MYTLVEGMIKYLVDELIVYFKYHTGDERVEGAM